MEKKDNLSLYRETFLKKTHYTARDGKQVYIPVVYHEKMLKIVQLICSMLEEHFRTHGEELKALYEEALLKNMEL